MPRPGASRRWEPLRSSSALSASSAPASGGAPPGEAPACCDSPPLPPASGPSSGTGEAAHRPRRPPASPGPPFWFTGLLGGEAGLRGLCQEPMNSRLRRGRGSCGGRERPQHVAASSGCSTIPECFPGGSTLCEAASPGAAGRACCRSNCSSLLPFPFAAHAVTLAALSSRNGCLFCKSPHPVGPGFGWTGCGLKGRLIRKVLAPVAGTPPAAGRRVVGHAPLRHARRFLLCACGTSAGINLQPQECHTAQLIPLTP